MPSGNGHQSAQYRQVTAAKDEPVPDWWKAVVTAPVGQRSAPQRGSYRPYELLTRETIEKLLGLGLREDKAVEVRVETHVSHPKLTSALGEASRLPIAMWYAKRDGNIWLLTVIVNNHSTVDSAASKLMGGIIKSYKLDMVTPMTRHQLELKLGKIRDKTP